MTRQFFTCPCCGYLTLKESPGSYSICPICYWEDDPVQLLDPWFRGGANKPNLHEAQVAYELNGAMELRFAKHVRRPTTSDSRDLGWRKVLESDRAGVRSPADLTDTEHGDLEVWYYWRRNVA